MSRLLVVVLSLWIPASQAGWPVVLGSFGWDVVKDAVTDTTSEAMQSVFKDNVSSEQVEALQEKVKELEQVLRQKQDAGDYPSKNELNAARQVVDSLYAMLIRAAEQIGDKDKRLSLVEKELVQIRQSFYTMQSPNGQASQLDFAIRYVYRHGDEDFKPFSEGATLQSGDYYKIIFTPSQDGYVYVFQQDSANQLYRLFPMKEFGGVKLEHESAEVKANQTYYLPARNKSFKLDNQTGTEQLYFIGSQFPDVVLEAQARVTRLDQPATQELILSTMLEKKGLAGIEDDGDRTVSQWIENGQKFSMAMRRLQGLCNGCVHILRFEHR